MLLDSDYADMPLLEYIPGVSYQNLQKIIKNKKKASQKEWQDISRTQTRALWAESKEVFLKEKNSSLNKKIQTIFSNLNAEAAKQSEELIVSYDDFLYVLKHSSDRLALIKRHLKKLEDKKKFITVLKKLTQSEVSDLLQFLGFLQEPPLEKSAYSLEFSIEDILTDIAELIEKEKMESFLKKNISFITKKEQLEKLAGLDVTISCMLFLLKEKMALLGEPKNVFLFIKEKIKPELQQACFLFVLNKQDVFFSDFKIIAEIYHDFLSKDILAFFFNTHIEKLLQAKDKKSLDLLLESLLCQDLPEALYALFIIKIAEQFDFNLLPTNFFDYVPQNMEFELCEIFIMRLQQKAATSEAEAKEEIYLASEKTYEALKTRFLLGPEETKIDRDEQEGRIVSSLRYIRSINSGEDLLQQLRNIPPKDQLEFVGQHKKFVTNHNFIPLFKTFSDGRINDKIQFTTIFSHLITSQEKLDDIASNLKKCGQIKEYPLFVKIKADLFKKPDDLQRLAPWIDSFTNPEWVTLFNELISEVSWEGATYPILTLLLQTLLKKDAPQNLYMAFLKQVVLVLDDKDIHEFFSCYVSEDSMPEILMTLSNITLSSDHKNKAKLIIEALKYCSLRDPIELTHWLTNFYEKNFKNNFDEEMFRIFLKALPEKGNYRIEFAKKHCTDRLSQEDLAGILLLIFSKEHRDELRTHLLTRDRVKVEVAWNPQKVEMTLFRRNSRIFLPGVERAKTVKEQVHVSPPSLIR